MKANPLGVTMGIRDFKPAKYWIRKIDFIDRLEIWNFWHEEAHKMARDFFLEHDEYTHFLFLSEDVIQTPEMVKLLIQDVETYNFPVVMGLSNIDSTHEDVNISLRDLRRVVVSSRNTYKHPKLRQVVLGDLGFPFIKVKFCGNTLAMYRRDVVEKLSFKPYKRILDQVRRERFCADRPFGIMFDLQMCNELAKLRIPIVVDARCLVMHFAFGASVIDLRGKKRYVGFYGKDGTYKRILEKEPYPTIVEPRARARRVFKSREEYRKWFYESFIKKRRGGRGNTGELEQASEESANASEHS